MSELTFSNLSKMLSRHGEDLLSQTNLILERVCNYWLNSHTKNRLTTFNFENDKLEITIPQCRFSCFSETRLVFIEGEMLSQVTFFVEKDGKKQPFHNFYLNSDAMVNYESPKRPPEVNWGYAKNVEEHFMNELIQAASKASLI